MQKKVRRGLLAGVVLLHLSLACSTGTAANIYGTSGGAAFTNADTLAVKSKGKLVLQYNKNYDNAYGGYCAATDNTATVELNEVQLINGIISGNLYGGYAANGTAENNRAEISGGKVGQYLYGGFAKQGDALNNAVLGNSGTVGSFIYGGKTNAAGNANGNAVKLAGINFATTGTNCEVAGGYALVGNAADNEVTLLGGTFSKATTVYGGIASKLNGTSSNNKINLGGYVDEAGKVQLNAGTFTGDCVTLCGGVGKVLSGNELNIFSVGNVVQRLEPSSFQSMNFYIPNMLTAKNTPMLIVNEAVDLSGITSVRAGVASGTELQQGDNVTLLQTNASAGIKNFSSAAIGKLAVNDFQDYDLTLALADEKKLVATLQNAKSNNENAKSPVETQAAGLTLLAAGSDMLATAGLANAAAAAGGANGNAGELMPFAAMGSSSLRVESGSYVDVQGGSISLGLAKEIRNRYGSLVFGPVAEYGRGSYDSYLDNGFHGKGDTWYCGLGIMARQTSGDGWYYEGSLRGGKLHNSYNSQANAYDSEANYLAAHLGAGKNISLDRKNRLECYGKYFFTWQNGNEASLHTANNEVNLQFAGVTSHRTSLGCRLAHKFNQRSEVYIGFAWQHEFAGTAMATLDGVPTPAPSLGGNTYVEEFGCRLQMDNRLNLDLGVERYDGRHEGCAWQLQFNWQC